MNRQRKEGILPHSPSKEHLAKLVKSSKNRKPTQAAVRNALSKNALKTHNRTEHWCAKDFEEYLRRIAEGITITEVGKDKEHY